MVMIKLAKSRVIDTETIRRRDKLADFCDVDGSLRLSLDSWHYISADRLKSASILGSKTGNAYLLSPLEGRIDREFRERIASIRTKMSGHIPTDLSPLDILLKPVLHNQNAFEWKDALMRGLLKDRLRPKNKRYYSHIDAWALAKRLTTLNLMELCRNATD